MHVLLSPCSNDTRLSFYENMFPREMLDGENILNASGSFDDLWVASKKTARYAQSGLLFTFFVLAMVGNLAIIARLCYDGKIRYGHKLSNISVLCLNLAVADITSAICCILSNAVLYIVEEFLAGDVVCKVLKYAQKVGVAASTFIIVTVSMDRFFAIFFPMRRGYLWRTVKVMVVGVWLAAVLICIPQVRICRKSKESPYRQKIADAKFFRFSFFFFRLDFFFSDLPIFYLRAIIILVRVKSHCYLHESGLPITLKNSPRKLCGKSFASHLVRARKTDKNN